MSQVTLFRLHGYTIDQILTKKRITKKVKAGRKPYLNRTAFKRQAGYTYRQYHRYCSACGARKNVLELSDPELQCSDCFDVSRYVDQLLSDYDYGQALQDYSQVG